MTVVGRVVLGLLGLLRGFVEIIGELLLDFEEGCLLVDEVLEEGGRGGEVEEEVCWSGMTTSSSSSFASSLSHSSAIISSSSSSSSSLDVLA